MWTQCQRHLVTINFSPMRETDSHHVPLILCLHYTVELFFNNTFREC